MTRTRPLSAIAAAAIVAVTLDIAPLAAQSPLPPDIPEDPTTRVGPLAFYPRFELTSIGVDTNVFNDEEDPKSDFTVALRPSLDAHLRFGIARFSYRSWINPVYFQKYADERSLNRFGEIGAQVRFTRLVPHVSFAELTSSDRPNTEIDLRADRSVSTVRAGVAVALLSRTALIVSARRDVTRFAAGQRYEGVDLASQLNSRADTTDGGLRLLLTALTTLSVTAGRERAEFDLAPERNSTSFRVISRFEFDPTALLSGYAAAGYRRFEPDDASLAKYAGAVADVGVAYTRDPMRLAFRVKRDVEYSYRQVEPYYVGTAISLSLARRVAGPFDVHALAGRELAAYRRFETSATAMEPQPGRDRIDTYGFGVGWRVRQSARLAVTAEHSSRHAEQTSRPYKRARIFGSVTYGL